MKYSFLFIAGFSLSSFAGPIPDSLKGTWKVYKVETDPKNSSSHQVPVGKIQDAILTFSEDRVTLTDLDCPGPTIIIKDEEIHLSCKNSKTTLPNTNDGLWFTEKSASLQKDDELAVTLHADGKYFAKKTTAADLPKPSFDCKKASTPTEKTICSRLDLANLDQQMAKVYKAAVESAKDWGDDDTCFRAVKTAHSSWLKRRNACGDKADCLEKSMKEQIETESDQLHRWFPNDCSQG